MANIDLGQFGQTSVRPQTAQSRVDMSGSTAGARALAQAGQELVGLADVGLNQAAHLRAEEQRQAEALARAKAANALSAYEIERNAVVADVGDQLARGGDYTKAGEIYRTAISGLKVPQVDGLDAAGREAFNGAVANAQAQGQANVQTFVLRARRDDGQKQFATAVDLAGKAAGQPGADIEAINARLRGSEESFVTAFGLDRSATSKAVQDQIDKNWTGQAAQRFNTGHDDPVQLQQLLKDLTDEDGAYAEKLDADKRNAMALRVGSRLDTLEAKAERARAKADTAAEKALNQMDEQISTAVPATVEQWAAWSGVFKDAGPEMQQQFRDRIQDEREIQAVLRQPIEAQVRDVQARQQKMLTDGADKRTQANTKRLAAAVEANVKLMTEDPLQYLVTREGETVTPVNLQAMADPNQQGALAAQIQRRATMVADLRKSKGDQVQNRLLLPGEAKALTAVLDRATPAQQADLFGQLRSLSGSDGSYRAIVQQIAPDSPVRALAGLIYAEQHATTLQAGGLLRSAKTQSSGDVARLILTGESMLNKVKSDRAEDGKSVAFPMPSPKQMSDEFSAAVGKAFASRPGSLDTAAQAVRAYYAGRSAQEGDVSGELDTRRFAESVRAVLGEPIDMGGGEVFAPWGMDEDTFTGKVETLWKEASTDLPANLSRDLDDYTLQQRSGNSYYVLGPGGMFVVGKGGNPMVLTVTR